MIYENGTLKRTLIDGGYVENNVYHFYLTDHLGNNRVVAKGDGTVVQKNHYYPFGMAFAENIKEEQTRQPYKFGNKELDQELGINVYDFEARQLTNGVPRFTSVDPLAEKYYSWSPYAYVGNNPLRLIDPTGMYWEDEKSRKYAEKLSNDMTKKVESYQKSYDSKLAKITKDLADGKEVKDDKFVEIANLQESIDNLNAGISEITAMGNDVDQGFAYKKTAGNVGGAERRADGIIEMTISGGGGSVNGVHESTHGYDMWKGGGNTKDNWDTREIRAYNRQYSYDNSSMPSSYWGDIKNRCNITPGWVLGAYAVSATGSKVYIYANYIMQGRVLTPAQVEGLLDQRRQNRLP